jgi:hypothetical protein
MSNLDVSFSGFATDSASLGQDYDRRNSELKTDIQDLLLGYSAY